MFKSKNNNLEDELIILTAKLSGYFASAYFGMELSSEFTSSEIAQRLVGATCVLTFGVPIILNGLSEKREEGLNKVRSPLEKTLNEVYNESLAGFNTCEIETKQGLAYVDGMTNKGKFYLELIRQVNYDLPVLGLSGFYAGRKMANQLGLEFRADELSFSAEFNFRAKIKIGTKEELERNAYLLKCADYMLDEYLLGLHRANLSAIERTDILNGDFKVNGFIR